MIAVFTSIPKHDIVYLEVEHIVAIIGNTIITDAAGWSIEVSPNDISRVINYFKEANDEFNPS